MFCNHKMHEIWSVDSQEDYWNCCLQISDFKAKMHQIRFRQGLRPDRGAFSAPPDPLAGFKGPTSKGSEGKGEREGKEWVRKRKGEEGERGRKGKAFPLLWFYNLTTVQARCCDVQCHWCKQCILQCVRVHFSLPVITAHPPTMLRFCLCVFVVCVRLSSEMSMIRWMCGVKLNERKKSEELRELLGLEPDSLMIKKSRLRWFGHVERKRW